MRGQPKPKQRPGSEIEFCPECYDGMTCDNFCKECGRSLTETKIWQDQPTKDGYYWLREPEFSNEIVFFDSKKDENIKYMDGWDYLKNITGKWYGPITPPEGD